MKSAATLKLLQRYNLPTWHFDIHTPKRYNKQKFIECYEFFRRELYKGNGLLISSSYCNFHKLEPTRLEDIKLRLVDLPKFYKYYHEKVLFSISDEVVVPEFVEFMDTLYPEKSPIEL